MSGVRTYLALALAAGTLAACGDDAMTTPAPLPDAGPNDPLTPDEEALTPQQLLGKRLFEDLTLSSPAGVGCISCHDPARGWSGDNDSTVAGVPASAAPGQFAARNAPTLGYAASIAPFMIRIDNPAPGMFVMTPEGGLDHDGAVPNLSDQAALPFLDPGQMNAGSPAQVTGTIAAGPYAALFRRVWGEGAFADTAIAMKRVEDSLAAYERTERFAPYHSRFDAALTGGTPLAPLEAQGQALFLDPAKGNCASCHTVDATSTDPAAWPFSSRGYATLGAPRNRAIPANADAAHFDLGLCQAANLAAALPIGLDPAIYCGAFRVPTLRNVAKSAPYMHNGSLATLRDAVAFHVTRDTSPERWYPMVDGQLVPFDDLPAENQTNLTVTPPFGGVAGGTPVVTDAEIDAIVAFLETLSDEP